MKQRDEFKPYPWKKTRYVSDDYFEEVEELIYNDRDKELRNTITPKSRYNEYIGERMTPEGTRAVRLDVPLDSFLLLDDGRLLNTWNGKFQVASITRFRITYTQNQTTVRVDEIFELMGWKFDHEAIVKKMMEGDRYRDYRQDGVKRSTKPKRRNSKLSVGIYKGSLDQE